MRKMVLLGSIVAATSLLGAIGSASAAPPLITHTAPNVYTLGVNKVGNGFNLATYISDYGTQPAPRSGCLCCTPTTFYTATNAGPTAKYTIDKIADLGIKLGGHNSC